MNWENLFKKYVWNEQTPYLTSVEKLTLKQANSELLIYCIFIGIFFLVASIAAIKSAPDTSHSGVAIYSFSIVCACVIFLFLKNYLTALYLSTGPIIVLAYIYLYDTTGQRNDIDTLIVTVILLCVIRYSFRAVAISKIYPFLPSSDHNQKTH